MEQRIEIRKAVRGLIITAANGELYAASGEKEAIFYLRKLIRELEGKREFVPNLDDADYKDIDDVYKSDTKDEFDDKKLL